MYMHSVQRSCIRNYAPLRLQVAVFKLLKLQFVVAQDILVEEVVVEEVVVYRQHHSFCRIFMSLYSMQHACAGIARLMYSVHLLHVLQLLLQLQHSICMLYSCYTSYTSVLQRAITTQKL
jgi:hypothetical protein